MQIFLKKNAFFGEKEVFFVFFGVAVMGLEGIETIEAIVWHFFFFAGGGAGVPKGALLLCCFFLRFVSVPSPSRFRPFAVFLPSFYRLYFEIDSCWY